MSNAIDLAWLILNPQRSLQKFKITQAESITQRIDKKNSTLYLQFPHLDTHMNTKCFALCSLLAILPGISGATPTTRKYECRAGSCSIVCKTEQGNWQQLERASNSVETVNHENGNVEFLIDDGATGKRTLLVGPRNLLCRVDNYN